ncbi:MAG: OmpA family protein [Turneriella sp.]
MGPALQGYFAEGALYSPFGGITMSGEYLQARDQAFALSFGYGSFLSRRVATGLSLTPRYVRTDSENAFGFGIDPALLFDSKWHLAAADDGFGIYSPSLFARTQNLSIPAGDTALLAKPSVHLGMLSGFYQSAHFNLALITSTYGTGEYNRLPLLAGIQGQYRWFLLSVGYGVNTFNATGDGVSVGAGTSIPLSFGDTYLFYSWSAGNSRRADLHAFSAGVRLGGTDSEPPEVNFIPEGTSFSPNNDGVRDVMAFSATVLDKSPIVYYEFRVRDQAGNVVYRHIKDDRIREKDFSWSLFFRSFIAPRTNADIPARFYWNGRVSGEKKKPVKDELFQDEVPDKPLADGAYTYEFWAVDEKNNESRHVTGLIRIDTKAPATAIELNDDLISPNGDGQRDVLTVTQDVTAHDAYEAFVTNARAERVRTWRWPENAPTRVDFDGNKEDGSPAEEGTYTYQLTGRDSAGNSATAVSKTFFITRRVDAVLLRSSASGFNPTAKTGNTLQFWPSVMNSEGYQEGEIVIARKCPLVNDDILHRIGVGKNLLPAKTAKNKKPAGIVWQGDISGQQRASDGTYCAVFRGRYENGNSPESVPVSVVIDTSAPQLDVSVDLDVRQFTPDGDGENEEQAFRLAGKDASPLSSYSLQISEVIPQGKNAQLLPVRRFQGKGELPQTIFWDGKTDTGISVESLTLYEYTLTATDIYGNSATTVQRRFETGAMAVKTGNSYLVRVPNADLEDLAGERLEQVYRVLTRYPKYKIKIEAHAATQAGIERTLQLTEAAARRAYEFMVDRGIAAERLSYQGFGDSSPAYSTRGVQATKNSRIDVLLSR